MDEFDNEKLVVSIPDKNTVQFVDTQPCLKLGKVLNIGNKGYGVAVYEKKKTFSFASEVREFMLYRVMET